MERFRLLRPHLEDGVPLARVAREQGIVLRTAQRWLRRYRAQGLAGLARQPRADRGHRQLPAGPGPADRRPGARNAGAERRRHPPPGRRRRDGAGLAGPELRHGLRDRPAPRSRPASRLAHEGPKAYRERFDLLHRREADGPNDDLAGRPHPARYLGPRRARSPGQALADGRSSTTTAVRSPATASASPRHRRCRRRWRCARRSGARPIRTGTSAASPRRSTPTTGPTSPPSTWSRSPPTSRWSSSSRRRAAARPGPDRALLPDGQPALPLHPAGLRAAGHATTGRRS